MDEALKYNVSSKLMELYCGYRQKWVIFEDPDIYEKPVKTVPKHYDLSTVYCHLDGKYALAVFAGKNATKFISVDVDEGGPEVVRQVVQTMVDMGIPREKIYVSISGKKGYHVDIFFTDYLYNSDAGKFYEVLIKRGGFNRRKVEFRPTEGSAIKLPLGVHQTTKNRCWYVDRETLEPIESFEYVFNIETIDRKDMKKLVKRLWNQHLKEIYDKRSEWNGPEQKHSNAVPANYESLVVTEPGTRHNIQAKVAARARMDGCDYDEIVNRQMKWYREQNQALIRSSESEVRADAEELAAWAVRNVAIKQFNMAEHTPQAVMKITKNKISYILHAPTPAARRVLFLLAVYCGKYGEAKVSQDTLAEQLGIPYNTVKSAVGKLGKLGYIKILPNYSQPEPKTFIRAANKYKFPGDAFLRSPNSEYLLADEYEVKEWITPENSDDIYIDMLTSMCTLEYLARFLKKPELEKCKERVMRDAGASAGDDAGRGA